jgi:hypothetical protein
VLALFTIHGPLTQRELNQYLAEDNFEEVTLATLSERTKLLERIDPLMGHWNVKPAFASTLAAMVGKTPDQKP